MSDWSRRDVLKAGVSGPFLTALTVQAAAEDADRTRSETPGQPATSRDRGAGRERLLLDRGWRFHFGHANDAAQDFGFGSGRSGGFQKTGGFLSPSSLTFDDGDWKPVDLPHDWAIGLPFQNDPSLSSKGYYPLGRNYPETSVGWYRRVFDLPASDAGRRISVEFDGSYRDTMVVFNGYYIGRHSGGYDPFSFDLTDFINPGVPNLLLVRVDATLSDGWFYEGAGLYRHVWLVKTAPVHVKKWGTLATAVVQPGAATVRIRTEVENHGKGAQNVRVISTILDPAGKEIGKTVSTALTIPESSERTFDQQVLVKRPALWSLEERNLHKLVTEVEAAGITTDRYETRFGIRDLKFDPDRGFPPQRQIRQGEGDVQPSGPRGSGCCAAGRRAGVPDPEAPGNGLQRLAHVAQSADSGASGRLRRTGDAGARRDPAAVFESGRAGSIREHGPARPEPSERLPVVDGE